MQKSLEGLPSTAKFYSEHYLPNPYPELVDDGSWEDDGGYVAKPNHQMWIMKVPQAFNFTTPYLDRANIVFVMHPLTLAELEHATETSPLCKK